MRANPAEYEFAVPDSMRGVLSLLARDPGEWLPIAGGTDLMVQYSAGSLHARKLVSIWNLPELRRIEVSAEEVQIGASCTYTDLRAHEVVNRDFTLLASAASWTGGIANQNRGTIGGNIVMRPLRQIPSLRCLFTGPNCWWFPCAENAECPTGLFISIIGRRSWNRMN